MSPPARLTTLEQLMEHTATAIAFPAAAAELTQAMLIVQDPGGAIQHATLPDMPGHLIAPAIRGILGMWRPIAAVLVTEAWCTAFDSHAPESAPYRAILRRPGSGVRDLPPEARCDVLWLTGETTEGQCLDWCYDIHLHPHRKDRRTFTRRTALDDYDSIASRFRPLFPVDDDRDKTDGRQPWSTTPRYRDLWPS